MIIFGNYGSYDKDKFINFAKDYTMPKNEENEVDIQPKLYQVETFINFYPLFIVSNCIEHATVVAKNYLEAFSKDFKSPIQIKGISQVAGRILIP